MSMKPEKIQMINRSVVAGAKLAVAIVRTVMDKPNDLDAAAKELTDSVAAILDEEA